MWALIVVGPSLERLLGRVRFLTVYLVSALAGSVLFYLLAPPRPGAGRLGRDLRAVRGLVRGGQAAAAGQPGDRGLIVINLVISFAFSGIAWQAHVGGLVAGAALTAAYAYAPRQNRALIQVGATVVIVAMLVIAVVVSGPPAGREPRRAWSRRRRRGAVTRRCAERRVR